MASENDNTNIENPVIDNADNQAAELSQTRQQAAKYRVGRNTSLKREYALQEVLKAHNIPFDIDSADMGGLTIANGSVNGEFNYKPPNVARQSAPVAPTANTDTTILTMDALKQMSADDINARWAEVSKLLKSKTP